MTTAHRGPRHTAYGPRSLHRWRDHGYLDAADRPAPFDDAIEIRRQINDRGEAERVSETDVISHAVTEHLIRIPEPRPRPCIYRRPAAFDRQ